MHALESARAARDQVAHQLNQLLRRFRQYRNEGEWVMAVVDGASQFAQQVALFTFESGSFHLRGRCNLDIPSDLAFPKASAAAFASAIDSKEPVIALRTPAEVTEAFRSPEAGGRAHLFPITNGARAVAVLFAAGAESVNVDGLELIAGLASIVLERQSNASLHSQITILPKPAKPITVPDHLPSWSNLGEEQCRIHIRAQRFSRVAVAEMQLARPEACRAGREQGNIYVFLKNEIDKARDTYRKQFMTIPSMADYLHLELVRTAAEGDESKLGADYPGQLV
jgi:hypothetical protein